MKHFAVVTVDGEPLQRVSMDGDPLRPPLTGARYVEVTQDLDIASVYFVEDQAYELGLPPTAYHRFDYKDKQWKEHKDPVLEWDKARNKRNTLLRESDFTQLADAPGDKRAWAVYRDALRDITKQADPFALVWPVKPT